MGKLGACMWMPSPELFRLLCVRYECVGGLPHALVPRERVKGSSGLTTVTSDPEVDMPGGGNKIGEGAREGLVE